VSQNLTSENFFSKVKILLIIDVSPINENFNAVSFFIVQIKTCHVMAWHGKFHHIAYRNSNCCVSVINSKTEDAQVPNCYNDGIKNSCMDCLKG